jgi:hypothetical protein
LFVEIFFKNLYNRERELIHQKLIQASGKIDITGGRAAHLFMGERPCEPLPSYPFNGLNR